MHPPRHYAFARRAESRDDIASRIALADLAADPSADPHRRARRHVLDLARLKAEGSETNVPAGQVLIERGHHGAGLFVVLQGSVVVEAPERTRELGPGSLIGERALRSPNGKRSARVRAVTDVRVIAVERTRFERLAAADPALEERLTAAAA